MARPAGYSSDEDFSDEGLSLSHDGIDKAHWRVIEVEEEPTEDKLVTYILDDNIDEVKSLIGKVELNYQSKMFGYWTPLMHACSQGNPEMVELLLRNNANPKDHFQLQTPLHCVCDSTNKDEIALVNCVNMLYDYGAVLNARDWYSVSPLSYAVRKNKEKVILKLISLGCEIDTEDTDGWTPIFYAVDGGFINLVQILKDAGACIKRIDHKGRTLYDIASSKFYKDIAEMVNFSDKFIEIEDVIDKYRNYKRMSNYEYILSELPDKKKGRFNGFPSDAARWIHGIGLDTLVKLFMTNDIQLAQIFTMDDDELKDLGVIFSYDRTKIRYCVQNFHQHSWGKNCLITIKDEIDLHIMALIICNAIRQLHIVSTATYFWKKHNGHELCRSKKDCINKGLYYTKFLHKEINSILKVIYEIEQEDEIQPCDRIYPKRKEVMPWITKKTTIITVILFSVIYKAVKHFQPLTNISLTRFQYEILKF